MIKGSIVALVTPFHEDNSIHMEKLVELIEWHIAQQTDGILVLGTTGESATISPEDHEKIVKHCVATAKGRIPIIVGVSCNCTSKAIEEAKLYDELGADYLLVITPYYNKSNDEGVIRHFTAIADAVSIPLLIYNIPGRTGMCLREDIVGRLSKHPNICGIKEASGNISYVTSIARYVSDDFAMYSGNDDMITSMLSLGASGVISVLANVLPKQTHDMVYDFLQGDIQKSREAQLYYLAFIHALFIEVNPIPIKEVMNYLGFQVGSYRLPLYPMSDVDKLVVLEEVQNLKEFSTDYIKTYGFQSN